MPLKTVLITGSSRGIGKAIARKFALEGYQVAINGSKNEQELMETKKELESLGTSCLAILADVGNEQDCAHLWKQIEMEMGDLDILVNNVGISHIGLFQDMTYMQWYEMIQTNLTSAFLCSKLVVPGMLRKRAGKIINISSVWGNVGASCEVAYSTTKGGMNAFTKALAKELAPSNIQVNAIACGAIDTPMNHFLSEEERLHLLGEIPCGRMGRCDEVAHLVHQLCQNNEYLTGQVITLDGGWT